MVYIYLVFYQEETWEGSVYSEHGCLQCPLNKKCIEVYHNDRTAANHAAQEYFTETLGLSSDEDNVGDNQDDCSDGVLAYFFWDASKHDNIDKHTLSKRVYVEKHQMKI